MACLFSEPVGRFAILLLVGHGRRMDLPQVLNVCFHRHGNWQRLWIGGVTMIWLAHLLSEGDQRLNQMLAWMERRKQTLRACLGESVGPQEVRNERLAGVLRALTDDLHWGLLRRAILAAPVIQHHLQNQQSHELSAHVLRSSSTIEGLKSWEATRHAPDLRAHDCILMHLIAQG